MNDLESFSDVEILPEVYNTWRQDLKNSGDAFTRQSLHLALGAIVR